MNDYRPICLTIAGFDPSAGAGVLADIKTFEMCGVYGMAVITANTFQTDSSFLGVSWIEPEEIIRQLSTLMSCYNFAAVKIGLVENIQTLSSIISVVRSFNPDTFIVWDPVLKSSSGYNFHDQHELEDGFPEHNCTLITPNWDEFQALWGNDTDLLLKRNPKSAILIKGGHRTERVGCDLLFDSGVFTEISGKPFLGKTKHGTGCVLSAAIAASLAGGNTLLQSCISGKAYVEKFILSNPTNLGYHYENK